jgi:WD40 repeat protein
MAQLCRGQALRIALLQKLALGFLLALLSCFGAGAQQLYERPVLVVDPSMHTSRSTGAAVDAEGRFVATGSNDKTVRIWSAADGRLLRTIFLPAGPGHIGEIFAVAMNPTGDIVAAGGWGEGPGVISVYLFAPSSGEMIKRIGGLPDSVFELAFSADGRYLAATCFSGGLRVFDRDKNWSEAFRDAAYGGVSYGAAFASDGRLATSSYDGTIRLYDPSFKLIATQKELSGKNPDRIAFSPDGKVLAVAYGDKLAVDLFDGHSLDRLAKPNVEGLENGELSRVAWSADGQTLFAGGYYHDRNGNRPVFAWGSAGFGPRRALSAKCALSDDTTVALATLPDGRLFVSKSNPCFTMLQPDGGVLWTHHPPIGDFRNQQKILSVSADGTVIDFGYEQWGKSPLRFDLSALKLSNLGPADGRTHPPKQDGLPIEDWFSSNQPKLKGRPIVLFLGERSLGLAIHPDGRRFVLGADWSLRAFDAEGKRLWTGAASGAVWDVNITGDGRLVVAAYGDGAIRWHRMDDGRELLALYVLSDKKNWVAWTPEGFYYATDDALGVLKWHVNRGTDSAAAARPVSEIPELSLKKRPDVLPLVLQQLETARALGIAEIAAARLEVKARTGAAVGPGAQLHFLAVGLDEYGGNAKTLHLTFAAKDANDIGNALSRQSSLYAKVNPQYLHDGEAGKVGILNAIASIKENMAKGQGQDLAVVFFSGHGAIIGGQFYLLPYGVDARTPAGLEAYAISAEELHGKVAELAKFGRVLVLLDACHSGAAGDGSTLTFDADSLRRTIADANVTVLTSSKGKEYSREDSKWEHGAFTKVLLDAIGGGADHDQNGLIWTTHFAHYVMTHVSDLTEDKQHPEMAANFEAPLFVAGQ